MCALRTARDSQEVAVLLPLRSTVNLWKSVAFRFSGKSMFVSACAVLALTVIWFSRELFA